MKGAGVLRPLGQIAGTAAVVWMLNGWVNYRLLQPVPGLPEPMASIRYRLDEAAFILLFLFMGLLFGAMFAVLRGERGYGYLALFSLLSSLQIFAEWDEKRWLFGDFPEWPYFPLMVKGTIAALVFMLTGYLFGTGKRRVNRLLLAGTGVVLALAGAAWAWDDGLRFEAPLNLLFQLEVFAILGVNAVQFIAGLRAGRARDELRWTLKAFLIFALILLPDIGKDFLENVLHRPIGYWNSYWEQCLEDTFPWALLVLTAMFGILFFRRFVVTLRENRRAAEELRSRNAALVQEAEIRSRMDRLLTAMGRTFRQGDWEACVEAEGRELFRPNGFRLVQGTAVATDRGRAGERESGEGEGPSRDAALDAGMAAAEPGRLFPQEGRVLCAAGWTESGPCYLAVEPGEDGRLHPLGERETFALQLMAKYAATFREYFRLLQTRLQDMLEERERGRPWASKLFLQLSEQERKRLASDLHDDVLQEIMHVRRLAESRGPEADRLEGERLERVRIGLENAEYTLRETCRELMPSFLLERGVLDAIAKLAAAVRLRADFELELRLLPVVSAIGDDRSLALYRMVQELMNNAVKHSGAGRVRLTAGEEEGGHALLVRYEDDGVGMELDAVTGLPATDRLGFRGMAERVRLLGGTIRVDSAPGQGLRVLCTLPLGGG